MKNSHLRRQFLHKHLSSVAKRVAAVYEDNHDDDDACSDICQNRKCYEKCLHALKQIR